MNSDRPDSDLGMTRQLQIDAVCVRFEQEMRAGKWPRIEDLLIEHDEPLRSQLLKHLLQVEFEHRVSQGERLDIADYVGRFPNDQVVVHIAHDEHVRSARLDETELRQQAQPHDARMDSPISRSDSSLHGRFLPGTKIAGRYRIVSLLGKGGMGEVYRADDLRLGHTVALKFLPKKLARDPGRLERFQAEVRLTRQISHPNVCRVYDMDEVDGQQFLSMEFIDGEDLRILLRRIGRLPNDKGIQIAQQLCSGLAAAHDRGVLHRDLKPANIMLDGRGQVRITDFGLAKIADDADQEISGTPAYMAPEQLRQGKTTIQSDLYSLGLILYELFTGKPVHSGRTLQEMIRAHEESSPTMPSSFVDDLDPAVERVITHCLGKEPADRPRSAHAVSAALPGGDPLAAALAAGETPSPELVAASGETGTLSLRTGTVCLGLVLVGLIAYPFLAPYSAQGVQTDLPTMVSKPQKLEGDIQEQILAPLGYYDPESPPDHVVYGLQLQPQPDGSRRLEFWYRQRSGGYLTPTIDALWMGPVSYTISPSKPPPFAAGMVSVRIDMRGRLIELLAVPDDSVSQPAGVPIEDEGLFELAGLPFSDFQQITKSEELRHTWKAPVETEKSVVYRRMTENQQQRAVVARDEDRLVYFYAGPEQDGQLVGRQYVVQPGHGPRFRFSAVHPMLQIIVLLASLFLALRNLRLARADRKGALRFAVVFGTLQMLLWLFALNHVPSIGGELMLIRDYSYRWTGYVFRMWLLYLALEPYVRRYWPDVLIAWTRALDGRGRNPLLGRELLLGCLAGTALVLIGVCVDMLADRFRVSTVIFSSFDAGSPLRSTATLLYALTYSLGGVLWVLMLLFLFRIVVRDGRLAVTTYVVTWTGMSVLAGDPTTSVISLACTLTVFGVMMTRYGLVAAAAQMWAHHVLEGFLITPDITAWYGRGTLVALGSVAAVALYGFYTSTLAPRFVSTEHGSA